MNAQQLERTTRLGKITALFHDMMVNSLQAAVDKHRSAGVMPVDPNRPITVKKWFDREPLDLTGMETSTDSSRPVRYNTAATLTYLHDGTISCIPADWPHQSGHSGRQNRRYR